MSFTFVLLVILAILIGVLFGTLATGAEREYQNSRRLERERKDYDEYFRSIEDD